MPSSNIGVYEAIQRALDPEQVPPEVAKDIAFHMTDWLSDHQAWNDFCRDPGSLDPAAVHRLLVNFLVHVPNHVAAAQKLLLGSAMKDVFGVGIFDEKE